MQLLITILQQWLSSIRTFFRHLAVEPPKSPILLDKRLLTDSFSTPAFSTAVHPLREKLSRGELTLSDLDDDMSAVNYHVRIKIVRQVLDNSLCQGTPSDQALCKLLRAAIHFMQELPEVVGITHKFTEEEAVCKSLLSLAYSPDRAWHCRRQAASLQYHYAMLLLIRTQYQAATEELLGALSIFRQQIAAPSDPLDHAPAKTLLLLGHLAAIDNQHSAACTYFRSALEELPERLNDYTAILPDAKTQLANSLLAINDIPTATDYAREAFVESECYVYTFPAVAAAACLVYARTQKLAGNMTEAEEAYAQAALYYHGLASNLPMTKRTVYNMPAVVPDATIPLITKSIFRFSFAAYDISDVAYNKVHFLARLPTALLEYINIIEHKAQPAEIINLSLQAVGAVRMYSRYWKYPYKLLPTLYEKIFAAYHQLGDQEAAAEQLDIIQSYYHNLMADDEQAVRDYLRACLQIGHYCTQVYRRYAKARRAVQAIEWYFMFEGNNQQPGRPFSVPGTHRALPPQGKLLPCKAAVMRSFFLSGVEKIRYLTG